MKAARQRQKARYAALPEDRRIHINAEADGAFATKSPPPIPKAARCWFVPQNGCRSRRGYHRVMRVARTLADLEGATIVGRRHIGEALSYRRQRPLPDGKAPPP